MTTTTSSCSSPLPLEEIANVNSNGVTMNKLNYMKTFYKDCFLFADEKARKEQECNFFDFSTITKKVTASTIIYPIDFIMDWAFADFSLVAHEQRESVLLVGGCESHGHSMGWVLEYSFKTSEWTDLSYEASIDGLNGTCAKAILLDDNKTILALGEYVDDLADDLEYRLVSFDISTLEWKQIKGFPSRPLDMIRMDNRTMLLLFHDSAACYDLVDGKVKNLEKSSAVLSKYSARFQEGEVRSLVRIAKDRALMLCPKHHSVYGPRSSSWYEIDISGDTCKQIQFALSFEPELVLQNNDSEFYVLGFSSTKSLTAVRVKLEQSTPLNELLWQQHHQLTDTVTQSQAKQ